jgi:putative membrane protein
MLNCSPTRLATLAALVMTTVASSACSRLYSNSGPTGPSDSEIAAILLAANNTDVSYAKLVPTRARSQAVKDFAGRMLTDHMAVNQLVNDLLGRINLNPEDNTMSLDFRDESSAKRDLMRELSGRTFDSTYIANEITYHTKLLATIDRTLLPNARHPQLKQLLANIRPAVAAHLAHANMVRDSVRVEK